MMRAKEIYCFRPKERKIKLRELWYEQVLENEDYLKIIIWLMGGVLAMFCFCVSLAVWVFREFVKDVHFKFGKNDKVIERVFDKLDGKADKERRG